MGFIVANNNNALFSAQPAVSPTGTLTYTPASGQSGVATVTVTLTDNGETASGGIDTSAPQTFTVTINPSASPFDFISPPPPRTITAGQAAQFTIQLTGQASFTGTVSFSCTAGVPPAAACSFNPPSVTPGGGTATTTLTVTTTPRSSAASQPPSEIMLAWLLLPLALIFATGVKHPQQWRWLTGAVLLLALTSALVACGGGGSAAPSAPRPAPPPPQVGTPAGSYSITVTGTSGAVQRSTTVTLTVQ